MNFWHLKIFKQFTQIFNFYDNTSQSAQFKIGALKGATEVFSEMKLLWCGSLSFIWFHFVNVKLIFTDAEFIGADSVPKRT